MVIIRRSRGFLIFICSLLILGGSIVLGTYYFGWRGLRGAVLCIGFGGCVIEVSDGLWCRVREGSEEEVRALAKVAADLSRSEAERLQAVERLKQVAGYDECYRKK